jgi:protease YdgD
LRHLPDLALAALVVGRAPGGCERLTRRSATAALAALLLAISAAGGAELPLRAGIGAIDRRVAVDTKTPPWDALAKVQTTIGTRCTGTLVAPAVVLTAAHCLYNRLTRTMLRAQSVHVLFGYDRGSYRWHRLVARYTVGPGYDGKRRGLQRADWARLELDSAIPPAVAPLPVTTRVPPASATIALAGYNQDRAQILMADTQCHVIGVAIVDGQSFIAHNCDATRGTSGGPLLERHGDAWSVFGINLGAAAAVNLALPASAFEPPAAAR